MSEATATASASTTPAPAPVWPAQDAYCDDADGAGRAGSCVESACAATPSVWTSYSSLSSSLCSRWASCTSAATAADGSGSASSPVVTTITFTAGPVTWGVPGASGGWGGPGGHGWGGGGYGGPGGHHGPPGGDWWGSEAAEWGWGDSDSTAYDRYASEWASAFSASGTWGGATVTITATAPGAGAACGLFDGSPWFVGPRCGWNQRGGFDGWVGWGAGWSWGDTSTKTIDVLTTASDGATSTQTGVVATVALAVSDGYTTSTTLGTHQAAATGSADDDADSAAAPALLPPLGLSFEPGRVTGLWGALIVVLVGAVALL